jgi:hypothetical protein
MSGTKQITRKYVSPRPAGLRPSEDCPMCIWRREPDRVRQARLKQKNASRAEKDVRPT